MSRPPPESKTAAAATVEVEFTVDDSLAGAAWDEPRFRALVENIVRREFPLGGSFLVSLHLVDDETIRALNARYRGEDSSTDVLSFPLLEPDGGRFVVPPNHPSNLGDVVISYPTARAQAREFGHSAEREIGYLVAHGMLHVLGYDHQDEVERLRMRQLEEEALEPLGFTR